LQLVLIEHPLNRGNQPGTRGMDW